MPFIFLFLATLAVNSFCLLLTPARRSAEMMSRSFKREAPYDDGLDRVFVSLPMSNVAASVVRLDRLENRSFRHLASQIELCESFDNVDAR